MQRYLNRVRRCTERATLYYKLFLPIFLGVLIASTLFFSARAQQLPQIPAGLTADQLMQFQQQYGRQGYSPGTNTGLEQVNPAPAVTELPEQSEQPLIPPSRLEQIMSQRAGAMLRQFGYNVLGMGRPVTILQSGAVQGAYVLGPGDEIVVSLRGQENNEFRVLVNRDGQVILPRLPPISAAGRSFASFSQDLQAAVHRAYVATEADVSLGRVRQINVLVSGEVNNPGLKTVSGLASAVDAILLSGGVKKSGSLRDIRVQRGNREYTIDLYSVLTDKGSSSDLHLEDGDRIRVPLLGPTVAITGLVLQPGIYELSPGSSRITAHSLLALAGGEEVRGLYHLSLLRILPDGRSDLEALKRESDFVHDSEILFVQLGANQTFSQAILSGGTGLAGAYPIVRGSRLSDVLKAPGALGTSPYTLFGIIGRKDSKTYLRTLVAFTPVAVLNGTEDQILQTDDIIRPLSVNEMQLVGLTVRLFLERQERSNQLLRDPLAASQYANGSQAGNPTTSNNSNNLGNLARSSSEQASDREADIRLIGSLTQRQLNMVAGNQVSLNDFKYLPERNTQSDIQGVYLPSEVQQLSPAFPGYSSNSNGTGPVYPQGSYGQTNPNSQTLAPMSPYSQMAAERGFNPNSQQFQSPPANYQEQPTRPGIFPTNREAPTFNILAQQLGVDPLVLVNFFIDHQVTMDGALHGPGSYFVGPNVLLPELIQAAGGTNSWADNNDVELISTAVDTRTGRSVTQREEFPLRGGILANYIVQPHDEFRFNQVFTDAQIGSVTLQGEVRYAGTYQITRGEHLSDLLLRAGGLTDVAYPYGTVFLRKSTAEKERDSYLRAANEINSQLVIAMTRVGNDKIDPTTFASMQTFVSDLRNTKALGRISIVADPSVLAANPSLDPLLEPGDVIYIPQRPSTISVLGQVMQPGSFPYQTGESVKEYIEKAGGYSVTADDGNTFIVLPDGTAKKAEGTSWLSFDVQALPPGSAIVVPRDVTPLDMRQVIIDVSSILSQLAVSIASVAVLAHQ